MLNEILEMVHTKKYILLEILEICNINESFTIASIILSKHYLL